MGRGIAVFFVTDVQVETWLHEEPSDGSDVFAPARTVKGYVENKAQLVRSPTGDQVTSPATVYTDLGYQALFAPNSRVTVAGVVSRVMSANANGGVGLRLPDHLAVVLL